LSDIQKNVYFDFNSARFEVVKFLDITNKIIPFFENYPIQGKKSLDFIYFKHVAVIIKNKQHLTLQGLSKILDIKTRMNE
jgi:hypothetical protein